MHSISHGCEINNSWYTGEVLQDDSGWFERNVRTGGLLPVENGFNIGGLDVELVTVSNCGLEENSDGVWEFF
jgi:hypothetical protein